MIDQMTKLSREERLLLLRCVCGSAWADGSVADEERRFVRKIMGRLDLSSDEVKEVESWLVSPPAPVDARAVPAEHRRLFLETTRLLMFLDGEVVPEERAYFDALSKALAGPGA